MSNPSPLRYPGGKGALFPVIESILYENALQGGTYAEPFAGGAAVAIGLLLGEHVGQILINDFDPRVHAFWEAILKQHTRFQSMLQEAPLTIDEWEKQRSIYLRPDKHSGVKVGFASFFLNRCNRSGIMVNGGPIGGKNQAGKWKIDARFNRDGLASRIEHIHEKREQIRLEGSDCIELLDKLERDYKGKRVLVYLDPPYFKQGPRLYFSSFDADAHARLAKRMKTFKLPWVMTYDHVPEISRLYRWANVRPFGLRYSAYEQRNGGELLIWPDRLKMPETAEKIGVAS